MRSLKKIDEALSRLVRDTAEIRKVAEGSAEMAIRMDEDMAILEAMEIGVQSVGDVHSVVARRFREHQATAKKEGEDREEVVVDPVSDLAVIGDILEMRGIEYGFTDDDREMVMGPATALKQPMLCFDEDGKLIAAGVF